MVQTTSAITIASPRRHHSCARDSYIRAASKPNDLYYDLPGMAEKMGSKDMTRYSFGQSPSARDSFVKAGRKCLDVTYEVPGMAEAIKRDPRGSYAFKNSGAGDRMTYITKHMKEVIKREPHGIPGMAETLNQKHYGSFHACCPDCTASRAQSAPRRRAASASAIDNRRSLIQTVARSPIHSHCENKKLAMPLYIPTNNSLAAIQQTSQPFHSPSRSENNNYYYSNLNTPSKHKDPLSVNNISVNSGGGLTDNQSFAIM